MKESLEAVFALEDGSVFRGKAFGGKATVVGEAVFNTSMTGYQEILTDPSYKSQFINFTFPLIGIVGCNNEDYESWKIHASGLICNELFELSSNWRAQTNFTNWIISQNSCAFFDLDTRAVTKIVRNFGPKNIMLCSEEYFENKGIEQICKQIDQSLSLEENDVIKDFTSELNIEKQEIGKKKYSIAFLNFGAKDNIKKNLYSRNCKIEEFDMNFKAEDIINKNNKQVINRTENKDIICEKDPMKLPKVVLDDTITDVMAAGPAKIGMAKGKIDEDIAPLCIDFSLRADLLSKSISIEINSKIIPPAILNEYNDIFR